VDKNALLLVDNKQFFSAVTALGFVPYSTGIIIKSAVLFGKLRIFIQIVS